MKVYCDDLKNAYEKALRNRRKHSKSTLHSIRNIGYLRDDGRRKVAGPEALYTGLYSFQSHRTILRSCWGVVLALLLAGQYSYEEHTYPKILAMYHSITIEYSESRGDVRD